MPVKMGERVRFPSAKQQHTCAHTSEDRMLAVQMLCWRQRYEKLTAVSVRSSVRHRQNAGAGVMELVVDLVFKRFAVD